MPLPKALVGLDISDLRSIVTFAGGVFFGPSEVPGSGAWCLCGKREARGIKGDFSKVVSQDEVLNAVLTGKVAK